MIDITELHALSQSQLADILALMKELDPEVDVTPGMIDSVLKAPGSYLFAALDACGADVAANNLYRSLGFQPKETNVYKMPIKR